MPSTPTVRSILAHVDIPSLRELAAHQLDNGHDTDEVVADIVAAVDAAVDWSWVPYAGPAIELLDGPIAVFIARSIVRGIERKKAAGHG